MSSQSIFYRNAKLGILGGGQLGRMLIQSCVNCQITGYSGSAIENDRASLTPATQQVQTFQSWGMGETQPVVLLASNLESKVKMSICQSQKVNIFTSEINSIFLVKLWQRYFILIYRYPGFIWPWPAEYTLLCRSDSGSVSYSYLLSTNLFPRRA